MSRSGKCIMICLESLTWGWTCSRHLAFLETSPVSDIKFWKPVYQLFKSDEPLMKEALRDFYVLREDSPVDGLVNLLLMDDTAAKFCWRGIGAGGRRRSCGGWSSGVRGTIQWSGWIRMRRWISSILVMRK